MKTLRSFAAHIGVSLGLCTVVIVLFFMLPEHTRTQRTARKRQTEAAVQNLRNSIKHFHIQYGSFEPLSRGAPPVGDFALRSDQKLMSILLGFDKVANPRATPFGEWRNAGKSKTNGIVWSEQNASEGILVDSWGNPFRFVIDGSVDGQVEDPAAAGRMIVQPILVYSAGPDGDFDTWGDNIGTWKRQTDLNH